MNKSYVNDIDVLSRLSGYGDISGAVKNLLAGFNHRNFGAPVPMNAESHGMTFFTRPRLNLSYDNVLADRRLHTLLTDDENSLQRAIRVCLDPESANGYTGKRERLEPLKSSLFDTKQAFITPFTNLLTSLSGWPDPGLQHWDSQPGPVKEVYTLPDDIIDIHSSWDATANFRNVIGDPITLIAMAWLRVISNMREGLMAPWPDDLVENRICFNTSIWRFAMDPARRHVTKWGRTQAFLQSAPFGAALDFSTDSPYNLNQANQISLPFHCIGAEYNDPILLTEFNLTVAAFNRDMFKDRRRSLMVQVPYDELTYFNFYGYPWIDVATQEMRWYVYRTDYQAMVDELRATHRRSGTPQQTAEQGIATESGIILPPGVSGDIAGLGGVLRRPVGPVPIPTTPLTTVVGGQTHNTYSTHNPTPKDETDFTRSGAVELDPEWTKKQP